MTLRLCPERNRGQRLLTSWVDVAGRTRRRIHAEIAPQLLKLLPCDFPSSITPLNDVHGRGAPPQDLSARLGYDKYDPPDPSDTCTRCSSYFKFEATLTARSASCRCLIHEAPPHPGERGLRFLRPPLWGKVADACLAAEALSPAQHLEPHGPSATLAFRGASCILRPTTHHAPAVRPECPAQNRSPYGSRSCLWH